MRVLWAPPPQDTIVEATQQPEEPLDSPGLGWGLTGSWCLLWFPVGFTGIAGEEGRVHRVRPAQKHPKMQVTQNMNWASACWDQGPGREALPPTLAQEPMGLSPSGHSTDLRGWALSSKVTHLVRTDL